jgi:hypothetical protein
MLDRVKELLIEQGELGIVFVDLEQFSHRGRIRLGLFGELLCNVGQIVSAEARERFRNPLVTCHRSGG